MSLKEDMNALDDALFWGDHHAVFHTQGEERAAQILSVAQFKSAYDAWADRMCGLVRQRAVFPPKPEEDLS